MKTRAQDQARRRHGRRWCGRPRGIQRSAYHRPEMTNAATTSRQRTGPRTTSETDGDIRDRTSGVKRAVRWMNAGRAPNDWIVCS
jgi:hypothetical protein